MGRRRSRDERARSRCSSSCAWKMSQWGKPKRLNMQSRDETAVSVKFWGVRGSIATAGEEVRTAGGNTACVEIRCGPHLLLFDAGTGLRRAGLALAQEGHKRFDIFLSHSHYDHVIGLPF